MTKKAQKMFVAKVTDAIHAVIDRNNIEPEAQQSIVEQLIAQLAASKVFAKTTEEAAAV